MQAPWQHGQYFEVNRKRFWSRNIQNLVYPMNLILGVRTGISENFFRKIID
jgi:hypothetical protein